MASVKREITEESDDQHHLPNKRSKHHNFGVDAFPVPQMQINPLDEPSPLGLRLRKSPSLLDLIQMRLSEGNSFSSSTKEQKTTAASAATDKLKASNFPASFLKIGTWEYTSKHEGDLVAKCYFAKHKLVWEVLDGGLKNKVEIQWSDIMSLKATYPDDGPGTLDIVLARQPLFYRETNPQPRKHTLWQATSDFTGGQASLHRRHCLQCPQGLLGKHYEKLIQCDPRLNFLSQQAEIPLVSPYFESKRSVFDEPNESIGYNLSNETVDLHGTKSTSGGQSSSRPTEFVRETPSPSSASANEEVKRSDFERNVIKVGGVESSMSMSDLVTHIENKIIKHRGPGDHHHPLSNEEKESLVILEDISGCLFNDAQNGSLASDEQSIMSRVNSLCCLLQKDPETVQDLSQTDKIEKTCDEGDENNNGGGGGMRRNDSVGELLLNLPRIASLPSKPHMNKANAEMKDKKKGHNTKVSTSGGAVVRNLSPWKVLLSHLICGIGLAINVYSINLIDSPAVWLIEIPIVIMIYSLFRKDKAQSSYLKAVARGLLGLPIGAIINALGAIALGAPIGTHYFQRTLNWSLLMSAFTFVPAACVYGSSWVDWQQTFVHTKLIGIIDYMICLPAHGAVIGAWFGAWPMPLDWERTWQEWPICVTYGAIFGYLVGMLGSICFVVFRVLHQHKKGD